MINDSATMATMITGIVITVIVFLIMIYSHFTRKKDLQMLARCTVMMNSDPEISSLCHKVMQLNRNAYPMLDKDMHKLAHDNPEKIKVILKQQIKQLQQEQKASKP